MNCALAFCVLLFVALFSTLDGTLSKSEKTTKKKQKPPKKATNSENPLPSDAGLTYSEILQNHNRVDYKEEKKFPGDVLGYVTPWNNHGYDVAKFLAQKFSHVSPVWFQIVPETKPTSSDPSSISCSIAGTHDLDQGWIKDVKKNNSNVKIVPRFFFDHWNGAQYRHLFAYEEEQNKCAQVVVDFIRRNKFHGAVLELWVHVMSMSQGLAAGELIHFLINWSEIFASKNLITVLPVPPPLNALNEESGMFTGEHFKQLVPYLSFINVMTYDFPDRKAGPVSPIEWMRKCLEWLIMKQPEYKSKVLMGLNFYGYDYAPMGSKVDPVVGKRYLEILQQSKPEISWNIAAAEHYIEYNQHLLYYPSLVSIEARLNLAKDMGVGIGIWDIGQGLDYFFNLF